MKPWKYLFFTAFISIVNIPTTWATSATCTIKIEDNKLRSVYKLEHKFVINNEGNGQRKHFEFPGNDYSCTLAFFEINSGTMLSCEYKQDIGQTFFQSDRTVLKEKPINNLTFRHKSSFITIETKCK